MRKTLNVLLVAVLCSCSNQQAPLKDEPIVINLHETVDPPESGEEWIEEMVFIPLETNKDCFINGSRFSISEKRIAFISDHKIHVFDRNGRHINSFDKRGKGPGEYAAAYRIRIMPNQEDIMIGDPNGHKILVYNNQGDNLIEVKLNYWFSNVVPVDDELYCAYLGRLSREYSNEKVFYELIFINATGEIVSQHLPFQYGLSSTTAVSFTDQGGPGEYFINPAYSYDIYKVGPGKAIEKIQRFHLPVEGIDTTKLSDENFTKSPNIHRTLTGFSDLDHLAVSENSYFFWAPDVKARKMGYRLVNRESGNQRSILLDTVLMNLGTYHGIPIEMFTRSTGKWFAQVSDAIDIKETLEKLNPAQTNKLNKCKGFNQLNAIHEEDNPVVILFKAKDF
jgi:hypothetical protein